jgi:hypothetical protein
MAKRAFVGIALALACIALLSAPVLAEIASLTRLPLGRGTATVTWTSNSGNIPTANSIAGTARGLSVIGKQTLSNPFGSNGSGSGTVPTSITIPSEFPLGKVRGTIDGAPFVLNIVLVIPSHSTSLKGDNFGHVTGTFRNEPVRAVITADVTSRDFGFRGTIGAFHITGVVKDVTHRGLKATSHATFDILK